MNFGYNFGVPNQNDGLGDSKNNSDATGAESQNSEYSSIDYSKIPPPTFKFGQFGQVSTESINSAKVQNDMSNGDDDSFLAEPSISAGQFDASFNLPTENAVFSPSNSSESLKSLSAKSVPILVEEPIEEPIYLEEPTPHSVEELMKATVGGNTSALLPEFLETAEDTKESTQTIQHLLETEDGINFNSNSWENIGVEEIKAAEAEFLEGRAEEGSDIIPELKIEKQSGTEKKKKPLIEESTIINEKF